MIIYARIEDDKLIPINDELDWMIMLCEDGLAENNYLVYCAMPWDSSGDKADYIHQLWQLIDGKLIKYSPYTGQNELEAPDSYGFF